MTFHKSLLLIAFTVITAVSCTKLVEVDPPITSPSSGTAYTSDALAASVLTGLYMKMAPNSYAQGNQGITLFAGLSADELQAYNQSGASFLNAYRNQLSTTFTTFWQQLYNSIYNANAALEGIAHSPGGMSDSVKKQLTGEAKFMRAFLHYYVINLYGDAPFLDTTDYLINATVKRTPKEQVYELIVADLKDAQNLLKGFYVTPTGASTTERFRPNKWTATALLARVYLYQGKWANAEAEATKLIENTTMHKLVPVLNDIFQRNSTEAIWQIQPLTKQNYTMDGLLFVRKSPPSAGFPADLHPEFLADFETGDQRKLNWVDSFTFNTVKYFYPSKYKVKTVAAADTGKPASECLTVFRLAEQYLIRAEARAQQNNTAGAAADLDVIRARAGLTPTTANDQVSLLDAIMHERRFELFTEWGHRWFDLKRTGRIDAVMSVFTPLKGGGEWNSSKALFPIPASEIQLNPNLAQNPGYN